MTTTNVLDLEVPQNLDQEQDLIESSVELQDISSPEITEVQDVTEVTETVEQEETEVTETVEQEETEAVDHVAPLPEGLTGSALIEKIREMSEKGLNVRTHIREVAVACGYPAIKDGHISLSKRDGLPLADEKAFYAAYLSVSASALGIEIPAEEPKSRRGRGSVTENLLTVTPKKNDSQAPLRIAVTERYLGEFIAGTRVPVHAFNSFTAFQEFVTNYGETMVKDGDPTQHKFLVIYQDRNEISMSNENSDEE